MRDAFVKELTALAEHDERVFALTADLGVGMFDAFELVAPGRFLNVGIAEQNLVGVAAGLAYAGKRPFAYSNAPFITSRAHDQVRIDVAYARAPVRLVGVGGGMAYGYLGATHHAIDDLAIMRALPDMTVLAPADPTDTAGAVRAAHELDGPVYLRLGKNGEPAALPAATPFVVGKAVWLRTGSDLTLMSTGIMLPEAIAAADQCAANGFSVGLVHFGTVKPLDTEAVVLAQRRSPLIVSVEEHNVLGGFGGAVAEAMTESGCGGRLVRVGLQDRFVHEVGTREYLLAEHELDAPGIAAAALRGLQRRAA